MIVIYFRLIKVSTEKKRTENFSNNALRHDAGNDPKLNKELMHKELIFFKI